MQIISRLKPALTSLFILGLSGCTVMTDVKPGTPLAEVEKQFGKPTTTCQLSGGGQRMVWSQQPSGQYAWATDVDAAGRVGSVDQILDDREFNKLSEGVWTPDRVRCQFGPPENISKVGLENDVKVVWSYRYRQNNTWYMLMYVFFDADGKKVIQHYPGPDPWYLGNDGGNRR
jgi:hypothetical protein